MVVFVTARLASCAERVRAASLLLFAAGSRIKSHSVLFARGPRCCARSARKPRRRDRRKHSLIFHENFGAEKRTSQWLVSVPDNCRKTRAVQLSYSVPSQGFPAELLKGECAFCCFLIAKFENFFQIYYFEFSPSETCVFSDFICKNKLLIF